MTKTAFPWIGFAGISLFLSGCLFSMDSGNPFAGLSCSEKQERMREDLGKSTADSTTTYRPRWIPPYGYPNEALLPDTGKTLDLDTTRQVPVPDNVSLLLVITDRAFHADIRIYDYKGERVAEFKEAFGYHGELDNPSRILPQGRAAYLPWNSRDRHGNLVKTANYEWDLTLRFEGGRVVKQKAKIGVWGPDCAGK